jgi:hypothetical protein
MTFFMKKRRDLPKQPDLSNQEGFGLFVQRDPVSGEETEILAAHDQAPVPTENARRSSHDITDVEAVDVVEPARAEPEADSFRQSVPGLRAARKPRVVLPPSDEPAEDAAPVAQAPVAPVAADAGQGVPGLRVTRKVKAEPVEQADDAADTPKPGLADLAKRFHKTPAEPQPAAEKPQESLLGRFSRKKAAPTEDARASAPVELEEAADVAQPAAPAAAAAQKKSLSGLFSRAKASAPEKAASVSKATSKKPAAKTRAASSGAQLDLLVELDAERRVYWRVTPQGLMQVEADQVRQAASFSATDERFPTDAALSYNQAKDLALSEIGEDCRIVNASKTARAVYATKATRIDSLACEVAPGVALVDQLLAADSHSEQELIVGFLLKDESSTQSLAILYHVNAKGAFSSPQVTVNPDNLSFTLSQFASSKRLNVDEAEVLLFKNTEMLSVAGNLACYPNEPVWNGVPVRKVVWLAAIASTAAAVVMGCYAGQAYLQKHSLESEQASLSAAVKKVDSQLKETISSSVVAFAATQAVDVQQVTDRAAQLWVPYSKVTLEATATAQRFDVQMPLNRGGLFNNRPSVLGQLAARDVEPLIGMTAPDGCVKDIPGVSGGLDAIQISISCESATRAVHRYRTD